MNDHWRVYESISDVSTFDANNAGPTQAAMQVIANVAEQTTYPEARIGVLVNGLGSVCVTVEQSAVLRAQLEQAERDVVAGRPAAAVSDEEVH
jgi:hypothetical protein